MFNVQLSLKYVEDGKSVVTNSSYYRYFLNSNDACNTTMSQLGGHYGVTDVQVAIVSRAPSLGAAQRGWGIAC